MCQPFLQSGMERTTWVALLLTVVLAGCASGSLPSGAGEPTPASLEKGGTVTVVEVVDGDTMDVRSPDGSTERVRLLGVDTPEVSGRAEPAEFEGVPDTDAGRAWLGEKGRRASAFARGELAGETVRIATDPAADVRGDYGRLLVYVYHDGKNFNRRLLETGRARLYDTRFSRRSAFEAAEAEARTEDIGVWGYGGGQSGAAEADAALVVAEIHADATGNDHENLDDEYIIFENAGDEPLDLSGWRVRDEAGHTYVVPKGFTLAAGGRVRLHTGDGTDTDAELYWRRNGAVWNNAGDAVTVETADGRTILERPYGQDSSTLVVRSSADSIFDSALRRCSSTVDGAQPSVSARSPWLTSRGMS